MRPHRRCNVVWGLAVVLMLALGGAAGGQYYMCGLDGPAYICPCESVTLEATLCDDCAVGWHATIGNISRGESTATWEPADEHGQRGCLPADINEVTITAQCNGETNDLVMHVVRPFVKLSEELLDHGVFTNPPYGYIVPLNDDDDNDNDQWDWDDSGPYQGEDELVGAKVCSTVAEGDITLTYPGQIKVFTTADKASDWPSGSSEPAANILPVYVEGVELSAAPRDVVIVLEHYASPATCLAQTNVTVINVDLDIDSDNTGPYEPPEGTADEDQAEHSPRWPGKYMVVNDGDVNSDGIPNFADGYDCPATGHTPQPGLGGRFVPMQLSVPLFLDPARARISIEYYASDPAGVTASGNPRVYAPAPGALRIWAKDGSEARSRRSVARPEYPTPTWIRGDYVPPRVYKLQDLGNPATLYVEATAPGEHIITVSLDPDGTNGPIDFLCVDKVKVTALKVDIAMDGNRDDAINFDDPADARYLFWVNNDYDVMHWEENMWHEDDDSAPYDPWPSTTPIPKNCDDNYIGQIVYGGAQINPHNCRRDLEDFTRLHIRIEDAITKMSGIEYYLKFEGVTAGSPSVNIFEAVDESLAYLQVGAAADQQIEKTKLLTVASSEVPLPNAYIKNLGQVTPFLLEGKCEGKGRLTLIVKKDGTELCRKAVLLELRPIGKFYQVFQVAMAGQNSAEVSAGYNSDFTSTDDYLLFVHGFNVDSTGKAYWPGTVFKRLWWQGYKGHVGWFDWPCVVRDWWDLNPEFFDNSENIAWQCGGALLHRINQLNAGAHAGKVRLMAHSQGNIIAGEALRNASGVAVQAYLATQAAIAGDHYSAGLPQNPNSYGQLFPTTPNILTSDPLAGSPYLSGIFSHVGIFGVFAYINNADYALRRGMFSWERNNAMKPDLNYWYHEVDGVVDTYVWPNEYFFYDDLLPGFRVLSYPNDRFEIYSYAAESRSFALGTDGVAGFALFDLQNVPLPYNEAHYSHSRQLRSNIVDEEAYWRRVVENCGF